MEKAHPIKTLTSPINPLLSQQHINHLPQPSPLSATQKPSPSTLSSLSKSKNPSPSSLNPLSLPATLSWQRNHLPSLTLAGNTILAKKSLPLPPISSGANNSLPYFGKTLQLSPTYWARLSQQKSLSHYLGKQWTGSYVWVSLKSYAHVVFIPIGLKSYASFHPPSLSLPSFFFRFCLVLWGLDWGLRCYSNFSSQSSDVWVYEWIFLLLQCVIVIFPLNLVMYECMSEFFFAAVMTILMYINTYSIFNFFCCWNLLLRWLFTRHHWNSNILREKTHTYTNIYLEPINTHYSINDYSATKIDISSCKEIFFSFLGIWVKFLVE